MSHRIRWVSNRRRRNGAGRAPRRSDAMTTPAALAALTETVYDAAAGGTPWPAVEQALKAATGARTAVLMVGDVATGRVEMLWREGFADDAVLAYQRHYRHVDLWTTRAAALVASGRDPNRILTNGEMLVPDAELLRSEFYNDFGRQLGLRWVAGTVARLGEAGAMPICIHRPDDAQPFSREERRLLDSLLPHIRRALQLRHRLRGAEAATGFAVLDALPHPVLVLDEEMRVLLANPAAEALAAAPRPAFRLHLDRLPAGLVAGRRVFMTPIHMAEARDLAALVRATAQGGPGGALRLGDAAGAAQLAALVSALPARLGGPQGGIGVARVPGRALVMLRPLERAEPPRAALLRELFGLTRTEAEVARALAGGSSKASVAGARGLKETTVRTQVRAILEKTGAANLRELERLLAGLQGM